MKFAVALLLSTVSAAEEAKKDPLADVDEETYKRFGALFFEEAGRWYDLPRSKLRRGWMKYMRGDAQKEMKMMQNELYKQGGAWDQFAGDDKHMSLDEARKMDSTIRGHMQSMYKNKMPERPKGYFKRAYDAVDALDKEEGLTKKSSRKADAIVDAVRNWAVTWKPTDEQFKAFKPVWKIHERRYEELPEDSK